MTITVVPQPHEVVETGQGFVLDGSTVIAAAAGAEAIAHTLQVRLRPSTELPLPLVTPGEATTGSIRLGFDATLPPSGYRLTVAANGADLRGGDAAGLFHATQTLLQLLPAAVFRLAPLPGTRWELPGVRITDHPRFAWRGMLLDCSRHFFGKDAICRLIDVLALHRFNVLHLHLTDDQGWRLEIPRYPRLTEVGSWRARSAMVDTAKVAPGEPMPYDSAPHDGFLTREDAQELVAYALERFITIVPEIDLPGHSQAAIAAYPELGNGCEPLEVWTNWGISPHVLNVSDATIAFYRGVLDEVMSVFPSEYVHIGGDECPKDEWRASPAAQDRMRSLGLADEDALQSWVIGGFADYLSAHGRRPVGWDEILEGGLPAGTTVMSWRGVDSGIAAAEAGHDVVMTPVSDTYLYRRQSDHPGSEPLGADPPLPLRTVYEYEPMPAGLSDAAQGHVLGAQCQMWTEFVSSERQMHQMVFPRASAFAEAVWCEQRTSYEDFLLRLEAHRARLHALGVDAWHPPSSSTVTG